VAKFMLRECHENRVADLSDAASEGPKTVRTRA